MEVKFLKYISRKKKQYWDSNTMDFIREKTSDPGRDCVQAN